MSEKRLVTIVALAVVLVAPARTQAETATERRLRLLEEQLQAAQEEIRRLRQEVREQKAAPAPAPAVAAPQLQEEQKRAIVDEVKKSVALPEWLKRIALFGDVRFRYEGFYHQPSSSGQDETSRNRERIRARVGLKAKVSDELSATVRLATGNPDDPISTNQTLTDNFQPKSINLDWGYLTLTPGKTFGIRPGLLAVSGGKFPNPIFRPSQLVFDDDLSLEGTTETVALLSQPRGALQQVNVHAFQTVFNEDSTSLDGWLFLGQVNPQLRFGKTDVEIGLSQQGYIGEDAIAQAANDNSSLKMTNRVTTGVEDGETVITGFKSNFNITTLSGQVTVPGVVAGMPLRLFGEYAHNWGAAMERADAVLAGAALGQTKQRGDWAVGSWYQFLEQDAVVSTWPNSDFGPAGTNLSGFAVGVEYQLLDPLTLSARQYVTNYIDPAPGTRNPTQFRLQLDALVKF